LGAPLGGHHDRDALSRRGGVSGAGRSRSEDEQGDEPGLITLPEIGQSSLPWKQAIVLKGIGLPVFKMASD
jgi:hypothetical protein